MVTLPLSLRWWSKSCPGVACRWELGVQLLCCFDIAPKQHPRALTWGWGARMGMGRKRFSPFLNLRHKIEDLRLGFVTCPLMFCDCAVAGGQRAGDGKPWVVFGCAAPLTCTLRGHFSPFLGLVFFNLFSESNDWDNGPALKLYYSVRS